MNSGGNAANIMIIHNAMATASGRCRFGNYAGSGNSFTPFDDNSVIHTETSHNGTRKNQSRYPRTQHRWVT